MRFVLVAACVVLGACSLDSSALLPGATNDAGSVAFLFQQTQAAVKNVTVTVR